MDISEMKPIHLTSDELSYELRIRGITTSKKDVTVRRKMLHRRLTTDRGRDIAYADPKYDYDQEKQIIDSTLIELRQLIEEFEGPQTDSTFQRVKSRLIYITYRIQRICIPDNEKQNEITEFKNESFATAIELESILFEKAAESERVNNTPVHNSPKLDESRKSILENVNRSFRQENSGKSVPVYKWNLKFSGESNCSLLNFLDRVEELCKARRVSKEELLESAVDLFSDRAYVWYKSVQSSVTDWQSLVHLLKLNFLPLDLEESIWEEIRNRTQGKKEPIHIYVAVMDSLFKRLERTVCETTKIKYIRKNLLPLYSSSLALIDISSTNELIELCRKIDNAQLSTSKYHPPPRISTIDPELVYLSSDVASSTSGSSLNLLQTNIPIENKSRSTGTFNQNRNVNSSNNNNNNRSHTTRTTENVTAGSSGTKNKCWNCDGWNHSFKHCRAKRTKFCFRCGRKNETTKTCTCTKNE